jgi:hypothetical protein
MLKSKSKMEYKLYFCVLGETESIHYSSVKQVRLTFAGFIIRSEYVAFMAFTEKYIFSVHTLMFTPVIAKSTVVNLCEVLVTSGTEIETRQERERDNAC